MIVDMVIICADEYLATNQLDSGNASTKPIEMANNTAPNSAFDKFNLLWISGILDDHVDVMIPDKKKNAPVDHRTLFLTSIF